METTIRQNLILKNTEELIKIAQKNDSLGECAKSILIERGVTAFEKVEPIESVIFPVKKRVTVGIILLLVGIGLLCIPTGDPTNPALFGIFFLIIAWIGAFCLFLGKGYKSIRYISTLLGIIPLATIILNFSGVFRSFFPGLLIVGFAVSLLAFKASSLLFDVSVENTYP